MAKSNLRENVDRAERHEGFARAAFSDDARSFCCAQIVRCTGDGKRLSRERPAQKSCQCRCNGVFEVLQWRVGFENAFSQCGAKLTQIIEGRLPGDTSSD